MIYGSSRYLTLGKFLMSQDVHSIHCAHEADLATFRQAIINIELTLERMSGILEAQAKLEERTSHIEKIVNNMDTRLRAVETNVSHSSGSSKWVEKIIWAIVGGTLSAIGTILLASKVLIQ